VAGPHDRGTSPRSGRGDPFTRDPRQSNWAVKGHPALAGNRIEKGNTMAKTKDSKSQTKKAPLKSAKQKRAAKQEKKTRRGS
jgi:hypothetical protein